MGSGCCSDGPAKDQGCSGPSTDIQLEQLGHDHDHDHGHDHGHEPEASACCTGDATCDDAEDVTCAEEDCDAETYCDADDETTCRSVKLECCTSKDEHCDGKSSGLLRL